MTVLSSFGKMELAHKPSKCQRLFGVSHIINLATLLLVAKTKPLDYSQEIPSDKTMVKNLQSMRKSAKLELRNRVERHQMLQTYLILKHKWKEKLLAKKKVKLKCLRMRMLERHTCGQ